MSVLNGYGIIHIKIISKEKRKRIALNYKPLWIQLSKKGLKKTEVIVIAQITTNVMAQMGKNKPITFKNLAKICNALECTPNDVFSFKEGGNE